MPAGIYWIAVATMVAAILVGWRVLPADRLIEAFADWMGALGVAGLAAFALVYVATVVAMGPAWALSVAAGVAYGFYAVPLVLATATAGATFGFLIARRLGREPMARRIRQHPRIEAIDVAVATNGFKTVLLLRLSPALPFGAKSYLLGVTAIPARVYLAATALGIVPGTLFYVHLGAAGRLALGEGPEEPLGWALLLIGLAATGAALLIIGREAQRRLRELGI